MYTFIIRNIHKGIPSLAYWNVVQICVSVCEWFVFSVVLFSQSAIISPSFPPSFVCTTIFHYSNEKFVKILVALNLWRGSEWKWLAFYGREMKKRAYKLIFLPFFHQACAAATAADDDVNVVCWESFLILLWDKNNSTLHKGIPLIFFIHPSIHS